MNISKQGIKNVQDCEVKYIHVKKDLDSIEMEFDLLKERHINLLASFKILKKKKK